MDTSESQSQPLSSSVTSLQEEKTAGGKALQDLRPLAMERLKMETSRLVAPSGTDSGSLLHELEIHQTELEIQNEELRRIQLKLTEALDGYQDLFDRAPVGYLLADSNYTIIRANQSAAQFCCRSAQELEGRRLEEIALREDRELVWLMLRAASTTGQAQTAEFRMAACQPGEPRWVQAEVSVLDGAQGRGFRLALMDTTSRVQAEKEALHRSEERLRLAQQVANIGTFDWDITTGVNTWTPEAEALYGLKPGEFGRTQEAWQQLLHPDDRERMLAITEASLRSGEPAEGEFRVQWPDGSVHWLCARWQAIKDHAGQVIRLTGVNLDITERKTLEREVLLISENERRRLAADLHDGICSELIGISFAAKGMQRQLEKESNPLATKLESISRNVSQVAAHARDLARGMNPIVCSGGDGLMNALRELTMHASDLHRRCCFQFECTSPFPVIDPVACDQVYRIAQEALHNAVRHSSAKQIKLHLSESDAELCLVVVDDGCGLPANINQNRGFGLRGMKYRADLIQGHLLIQNRPGGGTEVICRVPKQSCASSDRELSV